MKIYAGCVCLAAILDDIISHFVSIFSNLLSYMFRPACLYLDIDYDVYKISVLSTAISTSKSNKTHLANSKVPYHHTK